MSLDLALDHKTSRPSKLTDPIVLFARVDEPLSPLAGRALISAARCIPSSLSLYFAGATPSRLRVVLSPPAPWLASVELHPGMKPMLAGRRHHRLWEVAVRVQPGRSGSRCGVIRLEVTEFQQDSSGDIPGAAQLGLLRHLFTGALEAWEGIEVINGRESQDAGL